MLLQEINNYKAWCKLMGLKENEFKNLKEYMQIRDSIIYVCDVADYKITSDNVCKFMNDFTENHDPAASKDYLLNSCMYDLLESIQEYGY